MKSKELLQLRCTRSRQGHGITFSFISYQEHSGLPNLKVFENRKSGGTNEH